MTSLLRRRTAVLVIFFSFGLTLSSWVTRTPDVRDLLHAPIWEMGAVLFGLSAGSMLGILPSGALVARLGTRPVIVIGGAVAAAGAVLIAVGGQFALAPVVALGLGLFGLGAGSAEIALDIEGADVERGLGRSTLPMMHGFYSLGTVVGAIGGLLATAIGFPVGIHLALVGVLDLLGLLVVIRFIPSGRRAVGPTGSLTVAERGSRRALWRDAAVILIGVTILGLALAEGSANDWLPLVMIDGHGLDATLGSGVFVLFAVAMTVGRLLGGRVVDRVGAYAALAGSAGVSAIGIAVVVFVDQPVVAVAATVLWGLGAALGFPVALSAAAESGPHGEARVSRVATLGYVAFLVGPPSLGFLGDHFGLRAAFIAVLAVVVVAAISATLAGARRRGTTRPHKLPATGSTHQP